MAERVAIVTGSESGIGRAVAVALAEQGCDIGITWYRDEAMGEETAEQVRALGRRAELGHLDLRARGSRSGARATRGRWRRWSPSSPRRRRAT